MKRRFAPNAPNVEPPLVPLHHTLAFCVCDEIAALPIDVVIGRPHRILLHYLARLPSLPSRAASHDRGPARCSAAWPWPRAAWPGSPTKRCSPASTLSTGAHGRACSRRARPSTPRVAGASGPPPSSRSSSASPCGWRACRDRRCCFASTRRAGPPAAAPSYPRPRKGMRSPRRGRSSTTF